MAWKPWLERLCQEGLDMLSIKHLLPVDSIASEE